MEALLKKAARKTKHTLEQLLETQALCAAKLVDNRLWGRDSLTAAEKHNICDSISLGGNKITRTTEISNSDSTRTTEPLPVSCIRSTGTVDAGVEPAKSLPRIGEAAEEEEARKAEDRAAQ